MKNRVILSALAESLILESYKDVKTRFVNDGADKDEVSKLLDLHKKLKDMRRLKDNEVNIDVFTKGKSFDEFKALMSRYSENSTATKTDKWTALKNKIIADNDQWDVYAIDSVEEAYLFHGKVKWCISSGTLEDSAGYFYGRYSGSTFAAIVRKNPIGDEFDYIMDQYSTKRKEHTYWDKNDDSYPASDIHKLDLDIPSYEMPSIDEKIKFGNEFLKKKNDKILNKFILNSDGTYSSKIDIGIDELSPFVDNGELTIKFKEVDGNFDCNNLNLKSLKGCPEIVRGNFNCSHNSITSLKDGPKEVNGYFECSHNKLTSLDGSPEKVGGSFDCAYNDIQTLKGSPKEIGDFFDCSDNKLTTLEGAPQNVGGNFLASHCQLTSLKGAPEIINGSFVCSHNKLTSLEGGPKEVKYSFICEFNRDLKSLDGAPSKIGNDLLIRGLNLYSPKPTKKTLKDKIKIKGDIII